MFDVCCDVMAMWQWCCSVCSMMLHDGARMGVDVTATMGSRVAVGVQCLVELFTWRRCNKFFNVAWATVKCANAAGCDNNVMM
jgi:hypothetical protein